MRKKMEEKNNTEGQKQKVLTQEEVDLFLQWSNQNSVENEANHPIEALTHHKADPDYVKILDDIFDHSTRYLITGLRNFMTENIDVVFKSVKTSSFEDCIDTIKIPSMVCVFKAKGLNGSGILVLENTLIYSVIEVLMGGENKNLAFEEKTYTNIERNIIKRFSMAVLDILQDSFSTMDAITFDFERIETEPRFINIAKSSQTVFSALFKMSINEKESGDMHIMFPFTTIEPIKKIFQNKASKANHDPLWKGELEQWINLTAVKISALIPESSFSLNDILNWKKGDQILFNFQKDEKVNLCAHNTVLFNGHMGQKSGFITIRIEDVFLRNSNSKGNSHDIN
jgi:flagellar motor switch protein FliM